MRRVFWIVPLLVLFGFLGWRIGQKGAAAGGTGGGPSAGGPGGAPGGGGGGAAGSGARGGGGGRGPTSVEAAVAGPRELVKSVQAVGTAVSPLTVRLSPPTSGRIVYLQAREGDRVTAGETLVRIDPSQVQGQILQYRSAVAEAQSRLAQAQATVGASEVSVSSGIRTQRAAVQSAQAKLDQANKTLEAQIAAAQAAVAQQESAVRSAQADVTSAQAQVAANTATANAAQVRYERTKKLFEGGFIAAQDLDDARAQAEAAQGQVKVSQQLVSANQAKVNQAIAQRKSAQENVTVVRRQAQAAILTARADLRSAQAALATAIANQAQNPANQRNIEALQAAVSAAQGQVASAEAQLSNLDLKSPIDGTVTDRTADPGSLAQPGTPVLTVQLVRRIYVESSFPVELAGQIAPGAQATVTFDALPNQTFVGKISDLNRAADPQSRQFTVRVLLDNPQIVIRPGMFGKVGIVTGRRTPAVVVPLDAITQTEGKATVSVLGQDNTVENREVKLGEQDQQGVEILEGVRAGERVVTVHLRALRNGQKVQIADPNAASTGGPGGGQGRRGRRAQP